MELLTHIAAAKSQEYLIAVAFLVVFIFYWRLMSAPAPRPVPVSEVARRSAAIIGDLVGGFLVPKQVYYHPGHAWAKVEGENIVSVGMDDFAHKLVGKIDYINTPTVGSTLNQGDKGWTLHVDHKAIDMLSPIEGKVISINEEAMNSPEEASRDPYDKGWLMKVKVSNISANLNNLLSGNLATKWTESVRESLVARSGPQLGLVYQDGGLPIEGMARNLDRDRWDEIAREFFLTAERAPFAGRDDRVESKA